VLLVEDDEHVRRAVAAFLRDHGFEVAEAPDCAAAQGVVRETRVDAALVDHLLPDGTALDLLPRLHALDALLPVVLLTGHGSIDLAVRAVKAGAEQFFTKPVELPALAVVLERLLAGRRQRRQQTAGRARREREALDPFVGVSPAVRELERQAARVARSDSPVLVLGETGAGKGVLAAWIHARSPRADEPFVDLNCAALSRELLETELFGHERGAFTGAVTVKPGLFEVADRGTIFLDEIGDMDPLVQPKLLSVLEERRFRRVGGVQDRHVDVRLLAATNQDLTAAVREKRFRGDIYFRISTVPLRVPPLRERPEDIPALVRELLRRLATETGRGDVGLSPAAEQRLLRHTWPGNVRELRNVLERALLLSDRPLLEAHDFIFDPGPARGERLDDLTLVEWERVHIEHALRLERGHVPSAARRLGIPRSTLYQRLKQHGLDSSGV
jgi:DNA-binding NtrC family response regulator